MSEKKRSFSDLYLDTIAPLIAAMLSGAAFSRYFSLSTAHIFPVIFAMLSFPMFRKVLSMKWSGILIPSELCGILYTLALFLMKFEGLYNNPDTALWNGLILLTGFMIFFTALTGILFSKLRSIDLTRDCAEPSTKKKAGVFFGSMAVMLIAWFPFFLLRYPGDITADSISELNQAVGLEALSNHHPIAHTMMIRLFFGIGKAIFHDDQRAAATYSVCQMILLSAAFSYVITTAYKFRVKKPVILTILAGYALLSFNGVYSISMWKDVPFAALVTVFCTTLWRLLKHYSSGSSKKPVGTLIMLFLSAVGVCLFRSNGLYAYMFLIVFMTVYCIKCRRILLLGCSAAALAVALVIKGPVYDSMGVTPPDTIESLSLPAQQIAAVIRDEEGSITLSQRQLLNNIVDVSKVAETYAPNISDPIKNLVRAKDNQEYLVEHKKEFLNLWLDLGKKYPGRYMIAHILLTHGYWNPDVQNWVYAGEFRWDNMEMEQKSLLPEGISQFLFDLRDFYRKHYFLGSLWSIGTMVWVAVFMFGLSIVRKRNVLLLLFLPGVGIWLSLMAATPVFAEFRYAYSFFTTIPLLCIAPFVELKTAQSTEAAPAAEAPAEEAPEAEIAEPAPAEEVAEAEEAEADTAAE